MATPWLLGLLLAAAQGGAAATADRPNILLIVTDDQGYAEVGFNGNPVVRTPRLDELARQGVVFDRFYAMPVCAPTRAGILTGRYPYRTGVVDTFLGRALMRPSEVTLAERLAAAGYRRGLFGKWHLGDCYPMRPGDQGFERSVVHRGGGIGQPSDPPGGSRYFDPILIDDGRPRPFRGYCTDIFTDEAIRFLEEGQGSGTGQPFFLMLAFNAPHEPLEVPHSDLETYPPETLDSTAFPSTAPAPRVAWELEPTRRAYAMLTRVDHNIGRLLDVLDRRGLRDNTLIVFVGDNGPARARFNAGLRGLKGSVFEGGIRVPCVWSWPGHYPSGKRLTEPAAIIDIVPTVLAACGLNPSTAEAADGCDLGPLIRGECDALSDRPLFVQSHRGDVPQARRNCAVISRKWKLVHADGLETALGTRPAQFQLFDLESDPFEIHDVSAEHPSEVDRLATLYDAWLASVTQHGFEPTRIIVGSSAEPVTTLTRQDWRGPDAGWSSRSLGYWEITVERAGPYHLRVEFEPATTPGQLQIRLGDRTHTEPVGPGQRSVSLNRFELPEGEGRFEARLVLNAAPGVARGIQYAEIEFAGP